MPPEQLSRKEVINRIKTALEDLTDDFTGGKFFKKIIRGRYTDPPDLRFASIIVPLVERYKEENSGTIFPHTMSADILIYAFSKLKNNDNNADIDLDECADKVKKAMMTVQGLIGYEWQHDEEFEDLDNNLQGVASYFKVQFKVAKGLIF